VGQKDGAKAAEGGQQPVIPAGARAPSGSPASLGRRAVS